jgi:hypothetical protein
VRPQAPPRGFTSSLAADGPAAFPGLAVLVCLAAAAVLAACSGQPPGGGGGAAVLCPAAPIQVSGRALYEDKPYDLSGFKAHVERPVRFARVELRDADHPASLLGTARTDAGGSFCVGDTVGAAPVRAFVRVTADATVEGTRLAAVDYSGDIYYADTAAATVSSGRTRVLPTLHIHEDTPWKADPIGGSVSFAGGAFNILDVVTGGAQFVHDRWKRPLPTLTVVWQYRQTEGLGTFFVPQSNIIHVKGQVLEDSDEYDDDIILHEFGHFTMHALSKDTSPGGVHFINGNTQDMRLAFSEGWANFFSTMVRDADPSRFSNRSGVRGSIIDSLFTEGAGRALRFAYEVVTPEAFIPDQTTPDNQPIPVDRNLFRNRVVFGSSEVSVSTALWDIYAGKGAVPGIGRDGILAVIEELGAEGPPKTTFADFWQAFETVYPAAAAALTNLMVDERLMSLTWDEKGPDDTIAEVEALMDFEKDAHDFPGVFAGSGARISDGHTLFPAGDVDLFKLVVDADATVRITTGNLNDGADTYLRVLSADGGTVLAENDNYIPFVLRVVWGTDKGDVSGVLSTLSYPTNATGLCGPYTVVSDDPPQYAGRYSTSGYFCPPNAANRPDGGNVTLGDLQTAEYLASDIQVALPAGTYYVEVSRSPFAPPSAGPYGGYDLRVEGTPP